MTNNNNYTISKSENKNNPYFTIEGNRHDWDNGINCAVAGDLKELIKLMRCARTINPLATFTLSDSLAPVEAATITADAHKLFTPAKLPKYKNLSKDPAAILKYMRKIAKANDRDERKCIYFDPERQMAVATDGMRLIASRAVYEQYPQFSGCMVDFKAAESYPCDPADPRHSKIGRYPNWSTAIPADPGQPINLYPQPVPVTLVSYECAIGTNRPDNQPVYCNAKWYSEMLPLFPAALCNSKQYRTITSQTEDLFILLMPMMPPAGLPEYLAALATDTPSQNTPTDTPSQSKTATPSPVKKSVNWDELTEEERHPMPAFYTDLRDLARSHNQECAATYRLAAEIIDDSLTKNPDAWRDFIPGMFLNLDDCGLKMDGANHIGAAISEMVSCDQPNEWNDGKSGVTPRLCMIEKIIDCTDEDLQLFEYNNDLPEGCALGGGRCDDDEAQARALARMREKYIMPKEREAAKQKYYSYFFTLVTMYRSTNYCVFIDAEGYSWCRYLLFLPSWRTMYAADVQAAVEKEQRRQEEAAADRLIEETNALLKYNADCDRLRPYMVADLSALQLNDRQGRQNGRRRNILSALRHFFPGQKFSVKYRWSSHDEIEITWTDGPTQEEVENCCNWSIFCDTWRHFDGMTDSTSTGDRKFTNFAQQYGGGFLNKITFDRYYSEARSEAAKATARDILAAHGIAPDSGAHQTADEYPAIRNDIANRYGRHVADWLHNWSWLDTYAISRAILANNADRPAA